MKSRVFISIESFESIVNYHEDPEEVIFHDHRAYVDMSSANSSTKLD